VSAPAYAPKVGRAGGSVNAKAKNGRGRRGAGRYDAADAAKAKFS